MEGHEPVLNATPQVVGFCENPRGIFTACPHCDAKLIPEHAHYKCTTCGWRDSCCD